MSNFMFALQKEAQRGVSVTENGAIGHETTGKALLDLNFMLSSMRNMEEKEIWDKFLLAYGENPALAVRWLFFARDCREGCGERRTFRVIFRQLCLENPAVCTRLLHLLPFYGRWDDLVDIFCSPISGDVHQKAFEVIINQVAKDIANMGNNKPVSLLAKWIPSEVTSSYKTRTQAKMLREALGMTPAKYRKTFAKLRKYLDVTEQKMSAGEWDLINYETVPSRASLLYRNAFSRHDGERYQEYLENVRTGKSKINASVLYPYDIVHAYEGDGWDCELRKLDNTLEAQWSALPNTVPANGSTLVIVDGSGSMSSRVGNSGVTCHDVANSLGIYFAEKLSGPYHNSFITFSSRPQIVSFADNMTLRAKLEILHHYDDCSNTNIEKTFDLILDVAVKNRLKQEEIPSNLLIVSDMEFDEATYQGSYGWDTTHHGNVDQTLFDSIAERWASYGYVLPRMVFWNVCSRTGTIPVTTNDLGVALVSGFSPNIADMVMSSDLDPYKCLVDKLMSDRYQPVADALKE